MAKLNTPKGKLVRKLGVNIFGNPKFDRLLSKKGYRPGQHGQTGKRFSTYSTQLKEKQKIKFTYGMLEKQFRTYFKKAAQMKGETGLNLLVLLESRLDNVVYKLGFAPTRSSARQLVSHAHFMVNGIKVNIASYRLKPGDVVQVREKSRKLDIILNAIKMVKGDLSVSWLSVDKAKMEGTFVNYPERDEIDLTMNEQLVVEYYSR
ncbi:MAG TPA: 30S ribosomal protein S4 [Candidatus Marinimicrobia bacterium]|nr:30S ribosomal protein S4 [Candidatus Neomarinimicrobiota bacterium]|tara:strand:- start:1029 stop:1643 length:615 start_codon:yes stop_codon:yes gene_type:complete